MSILRVQKVVVETVNLVSSSERIRKVEPRFTDEYQGGFLLKDDGTKIKLIPGETRDIPGKILNEEERLFCISMGSRLV